MSKFFEHPIFRQVIIFIAPVLACMACLVIFGNANIIEVFEELFEGAGYIIPFSVFTYIIAWIAEKFNFSPI